MFLQSTFEHDAEKVIVHMKTTAEFARMDFDFVLKGHYVE